MAHYWRIFGSRPSDDGALLVRGDRVVATTRREDSLADLQREYGDRLVVSVLDLTDTAGIRAILARAFRQLGRIDVLVSNAGYGYSARPKRSRIRKSIIRLRPILSARSNSSGRPFRTSGSRAVGESFKFHPKAARSHTRPLACITQPNGALKALSNPWLRRSRLSESTSLSSNPVRPQPISALAW